MKVRMELLGGLLAVIAVVLAGYAIADEFEMIRWTVDGGGVLHAGGDEFELSGTIGQADAGLMMTGDDFELTGGFWFRLAVGDCNGDSGVNLFDFDAFSACITEPGAGLLEAGCACFDFDGDDDVDLHDFGGFQAAFTGP